MRSLFHCDIRVEPHRVGQLTPPGISSLYSNLASARVCCSCHNDISNNDREKADVGENRKKIAQLCRVEFICHRLAAAAVRPFAPWFHSSHSQVAPRGNSCAPKWRRVTFGWRALGDLDARARALESRPICPPGWLVVSHEFIIVAPGSGAKATAAGQMICLRPCRLAAWPLVRGRPG